MVQSKNMSMLIVIVVAATLLHNIEAADYIVGDSTGWRNSPPGGDSFYSNWANNITFRVNDVLIFNFVTGSHSVAELTKTNFDSCDVSQSIQVIATSPARVTLNRSGEFYFSCTFQGHCGAGQKLSVNVIASSPPPTQSPAPRSASPPPQSASPPRSASPPPQSASPPRSASPPPQSASPPKSNTTPTTPPTQSPSPRSGSPPVSGTTPRSPPSNEAAPPTTDAGATPPSPGSATTVIATYSLVIVTVVINILF